MKFKFEKGKEYLLSRYSEDSETGEYVGLRKHVYGERTYYKPLFKLKEGYCTLIPDVNIEADGTLSIVLEICDYYKSIEDVVKPTVRPKETIEVIE